MSNDALIKTMRASDGRLRQTETREVSPLYLPWAQRALNPFPLASSGGVWGDMGQPWAVNLLRFTVSVFVSTTNNGTNFWTLDLIDPAATLLCQITTAAIAAGTWTRLSSVLFVQPSAANVVISLRLTATLAPGQIFVAPALALLRTGN